jgi:hypothetical protein
VTPADYAALTQAGAAVLALAVAVAVPIYLRIKEDERRVQERGRQRAREQYEARQKSFRAYSLASLFAQMLDSAVEDAMNAAKEESETAALKARSIIERLPTVAESIDLLALTPESASALIVIRAIAIEAVAVLQQPATSWSHTLGRLGEVRAALRPKWTTMQNAMPGGLQSLK